MRFPTFVLELHYFFSNKHDLFMVLILTKWYLKAQFVLFALRSHWMGVGFVVNMQ